MNLNRRKFIQLAGSGMTALAVPPLFAGQASAYPCATVGKPVVVVIFLRGGADSLTHVLPDPMNSRSPVELEQITAYNAARPSIAVNENDIVQLTQNYSDPNHQIQAIPAGLHANYFGANSALDELFDEHYSNAIASKNNLAVVHACGNTGIPNYSHFTAQDALERGVESPIHASSGWLTRAVEAVAAVDTQNNTPLNGVSISANPIASLSGGTQNLTLALPSIKNFGLTRDQHPPGAREAALAAIYSQLRNGPTNTVASSTILAKAGQGLFQALDAVNGETMGIPDLPPSGLDAGKYLGPHLPSQMQNRLSDAARLIKQPAFGVRAVAMDFHGNWDYHTDSVGQTPGYTMRLAATLKRFYDDLNHPFAGGIAAERVVTIVMSEFGRTVRENGLGGPAPGTDHGHGGAMYVMGAGVHGGRVLCRADGETDLKRVGWPGLRDADLHLTRDLKATIDARDVLAEVVQQQFPEVTDIPGLFNPTGNHPYTPVALPDDGLFPLGCS
ncbi:MAG: hypothetical protein ACI8W3_002124 [Myxococcota bacterium]|jgi:uncharacterized protein (DUF1501 family)